MSEDRPTVPDDLVARLLPVVQQVMRVQDSTTGPGKGGFLARFRGDLTLPPDQVYTRLAGAFEAQGVQLVARSEGGRPAIFAVEALPAVQRSNPWINLGLFALTVWLLNGKTVPTLAVAMVLLALAIVRVPFRDPDADRT